LFYTPNRVFLHLLSRFICVSAPQVEIEIKRVTILFKKCLFFSRKLDEQSREGEDILKNSNWLSDK
jgi:hypothetical protein